MNRPKAYDIYRDAKKEKTKTERKNGLKFERGNEKGAKRPLNREDGSGTGRDKTFAKIFPRDAFRGIKTLLLQNNMIEYLRNGK